MRSGESASSNSELHRDDPAVSGNADEIVARLERLPFTPVHLYVATVLGVGTFFDAFDSLSIAVSLTVIFTTLHVDLINTGLLISSAYAGQFLGALVIGWLAERFGRKTAFALSLMLFGLMSLATAMAWNFESLFVFRLIQGIGLGAEVPVAGTLFNEFVRGKDRGKVVMIYETLFIWGLFLAPLAGLFLFRALGPAVGWRALFAVGGLPFLVGIYAWLRLPESPRWLAGKGLLAEAGRLVSRVEASARLRGAVLAPPQTRVRSDVRPTRLAELFGRAYRRRTVLVWVHWFTAYFVNSVVTGWLPTMYVRFCGLPPQRSLVLATITGGALVVVGYSMAFTIDRIGRKPIFIFAFALTAFGALLGLVLITILGATTWPVLFISGLLMQFGAGLNCNGVYVYTPELYPTRMRAWATALASSMNRLASFIAPAATGALLGLKFGVHWMFVLMALSSVAGLVIMVTLGIETKQRALEEISV